MKVGPGDEWAHNTAKTTIASASECPLFQLSARRKPRLFRSSAADTRRCTVVVQRCISCIRRRSGRADLLQYQIVRDYQTEHL